MITTLLTQTPRAWRAFIVAAAAMVVLAGTSAHAAVITAVNTGSKVLQDSGSGSTVVETTPQTLSFDAGATADALLVVLSSESGASPGQVSITYDGFAFTPVLDHSDSQPSIWLLNLSGTTYVSGSANLVLDMTGVTTVNGYGLGVVSVNADGKDIVDHALNTSAAKSVSLTTTADSSFIVAGHRANSASGSASASSPLTQLFGAQIGSSQGAAGYVANVAAGTASYSFTGSASGPLSSAAAFVIIPAPAALPAGLALLGLAMVATRRRSAKLTTGRRTA